MLSPSLTSRARLSGLSPTSPPHVVATTAARTGSASHGCCGYSRHSCCSCCSRHGSLLARASPASCSPLAYAAAVSSLLARAATSWAGALPWKAWQPHRWTPSGCRRCRCWGVLPRATRRRAFFLALLAGVFLYVRSPHAVRVRRLAVDAKAASATAKLCKCACGRRLCNSRRHGRVLGCSRHVRLCARACGCVRRGVAQGPNGALMASSSGPAC